MFRNVTPDLASSLTSFRSNLNSYLFSKAYPPYFLSPACGRRPWSGDYKTPSVLECIRLCVRSSCLCINLNNSFIYSSIFTKFAGYVYGYKNLSLKNFSLILKNKMATIVNCLQIVKVLIILKYSSLLHQICTKAIWLEKLASW